MTLEELANRLDDLARDKQVEGAERAADQDDRARGDRLAQGGHLRSRQALVRITREDAERLEAEKGVQQEL